MTRKAAFRFGAGIAAIVIGSIIITLLTRTMTVASRQLEVPMADEDIVPNEHAAERLAQAIRFPTLWSGEVAEIDTTPFEQLHAFLADAFPNCWHSLEREVVGRHGLLLTWRGSDPSLEPIVLMAHQDVVPVEPHTRARWTHDPFGGVIAGGYIWGRGALDDKNGLLATFEAVEYLLARDYRPARTIYLAFGHDEEVGGNEGARQIATLLAARGARGALVLDEGHLIADGMLPGLDRPVALIGLAEKGYLTLEVEVQRRGGHSSMPPPHTAAGALAQKLVRLEQHPLPGALDGPVRQMFEHVAAEMPLHYRFVFANLWLFDSLVERMLAAKPDTNALIRTTTAITMLRAGPRENVLPKRASATINFRLHPRDDMQSVLSHVARQVGDSRTRVVVHRSTGSEPSAISRIDQRGFRALTRAIRETWPGVLVAPSLTVGATDSRHFREIADAIYRFRPMVLTTEDTRRIHGIDERISIEDYLRGIAFTIRFIRLASSAE